jgi:hypothetical protein
MFVEGYIDRGFLTVVTEAGFDVVWKCDSPEEAKAHGYDELPTNDTDTIARIFFDEDIEDYLLPILLNSIEQEHLAIDMGVANTKLKTLRQKLLPLMAVCANEKMRDYAIQQLKG